MAVATDCKTSGAVYGTHITENRISIEIELPDGVLEGISEIQADGVRDDLHNALEMALAPYFVTWSWATQRKRDHRDSHNRFNDMQRRALTAERKLAEIYNKNKW